MLTAEQLARFDSDGFTVINDVFSPAEVEHLRREADAQAIHHELQVRGLEHKGIHLFELAVRAPAFRQLAGDHRIVDSVAQLIGDDVQLHHSKLAVQPTLPGAGGFECHQDFPFLPHTNTDLVAVMVMLDDATLENGCMHAVPGSHKLGVLPFERSTGFIEGDALLDAQRRSVPLMPRAGGLSIHHVLTVHYSECTRSRLPRRGIVLQYRNADAHQLGDKYFPETGYQVRGEYRGHVRCASAQFTLRSDMWRGYGTSLVHVGEIARRWNEEERFARGKDWSPFRQLDKSGGEPREKEAPAPHRSA